MARGLGNQNMKKYHMWNLSHQDINNKVCFRSAPLGCIPQQCHAAVVQTRAFVSERTILILAKSFFHNLWC